MVKKIFLTIIAFFSLNALAIDNPLPPEKAFHFNAQVEKNSIMIYGSTEKDYRLYRDSIKIINNKSSVKLGEIIKSPGKKIYNEFLNKYQDEYEGDFALEIPITGKGKVEFDLQSQGCTKGLCYSPFLTNIKINKVK